MPLQQHALMILRLLDQLINLRNGDVNYADLVQNLVIISEESSSWLVIRKNPEERVQSMFRHTNIKIRAEGKRHLGAVIKTIIINKTA